MADHRGYWSQVGREARAAAVSAMQRVRRLRERGVLSGANRIVAGSAVMAVVAVGVLVAGIMAATAIAPGFARGNSISVAEPESPGDYNIMFYTEVDFDGEYDPDLMVNLISEEYGEEAFRLVAEDVRYKNPNHDIISIGYKYYDDYGEAIHEGVAVTINASEHAPGAWPALSEAEAEEIIREDNGIYLVMTD